ncbi:hypothetical protein RIR_jg19890.t1 [Rhizophagus irregularis DAOM 181602=DAOM 197198]|nr:hypothetical protein RIR_jg19890.t1 [Rhizophagus irregularis DAOM 181602=DAOM 197198]
MEDMENWFITRDSTEHRRNALAWRSCNSTNSRKNFVSEKGIQHWSKSFLSALIPFVKSSSSSSRNSSHIRLITKFGKISA